MKVLLLIVEQIVVGRTSHIPEVQKFKSVDENGWEKIRNGFAGDKA